MSDNNATKVDEVELYLKAMRENDLRELGKQVKKIKLKGGFTCERAPVAILRKEMQLYFRKNYPSFVQIIKCVASQMEDDWGGKTLDEFLADAYIKNLRPDIALSLLYSFYPKEIEKQSFIAENIANNRHPFYRENFLSSQLSADEVMKKACPIPSFNKALKKIEPLLSWWGANEKEKNEKIQNEIKNLNWNDFVQKWNALQEEYGEFELLATYMSLNIKDIHNELDKEKQEVYLFMITRVSFDFGNYIASKLFDKEAENIKILKQKETALKQVESIQKENTNLKKKLKELNEQVSVDSKEKEKLNFEYEKALAKIEALIEENQETFSKVESIFSEESFIDREDLVLINQNQSELSKLFFPKSCRISSDKNIANIINDITQNGNNKTVIINICGIKQTKLLKLEEALNAKAIPFTSVRASGALEEIYKIIQYETIKNSYVEEQDD